MEITPPKKGEHRCFAIENKVSHDPKASIQLQANMMLLASEIMIEAVTQKDPERISSITCYGILIGLLHPLKVLKLTVDFDAHRATYTRKFFMKLCLKLAAYADLCTGYVCKCLTKRKCNC